MFKSTLHKNSASCNREVSPDAALEYIYLFTTLLSIFMVAWILIYPSSWLMGYSKRHDAWINQTLVEPYDGSKIHPKVVTKYAGHPEVQFTHIFPAAIWSAAIPLQLHKRFRSKYKVSHRIVGYAFLGSSFLMTLGVFLIVIKKLTFDYDYEGLAPPLSAFKTIRTKATILGMGLWFAFTSLKAIIEARKKRFQSHKHYIYRHIGSGLWVAIQRLMIPVFGPQKNPEAMRERFGDGALIGIVIALSLAEMAVSLDRQLGKKSKTPRRQGGHPGEGEVEAGDIVQVLAEDDGR